MYKRAGRLVRLGRPLDLVGASRPAVSRKSKKRGKAKLLGKKKRKKPAGAQNEPRNARRPLRTDKNTKPSEKKTGKQPRAKAHKHAEKEPGSSIAGVLLPSRIAGVLMPGIAKDPGESFSVELSHEAFGWMWRRIVDHRGVKITSVSVNKNGDFSGCSFTGPMDDFFERLLHAALANDGSEFFRNLKHGHEGFPRKKRKKQPVSTCAKPSVKVDRLIAQRAALEQLRLEDGVVSVTPEGLAVIAVTLRNAPLDPGAVAERFARIYASSVGLKYAKCFLLYANAIVGRARFWAG